MTAPVAPAYGTVTPDHPRATLALILGILGIVACMVVAPFALVIGRGAVKDIDASGGRLGGRSMAQAGFILTGVTAAGQSGIAAAMFYLIAYAAMIAFGVTLFVSFVVLFRVFLDRSNDD